MSLRVTGQNKRLSVRLPGEGQTWIRQGDEMIPADLGGPALDVQEVISEDGAAAADTMITYISGARTVTLPTVGLTDGQQKRIIQATDHDSAIDCEDGATGNDGVSDIDSIALTHKGDFCVFFWRAGSGHWYLAEASYVVNGGGVTVTPFL